MALLEFPVVSIKNLGFSGLFHLETWSNFVGVSIFLKFWVLTLDSLLKWVTFFL